MTYRLINTLQKLKETEEIFQALPDNHVFGLDLETTGLYCMDDTVCGAGLSWEDGEACYIPYFHTDSEDWGFGREEVRNILSSLRRFRIVAHKAVFDFSFLYTSFGLALPMWDDSYLLAKLLQKPLSLDDILFAEFGKGKSTTFAELMVENFGRQWKKNKKSAADLASEQISDYCCGDADGTRKAYFKYKPQLKPNGLSSIHKIEVNVLPFVRRLNVKGAPINPEKARFLAELLHKQNAILEEEIYDLAGGCFKINSPRECPAVLFGPTDDGGLGLPVIKRSQKTGAPSTDEESMNALMDQHPIVGKIKKWREDTRLWKAYFNKLPDMLADQTGRVHTEFNSFGAISGRFTSSGNMNHKQEKKGLNLQNIAKTGVDFAMEMDVQVPEGESEEDWDTVERDGVTYIDGMKLWNRVNSHKSKGGQCSINKVNVSYKSSVRECFEAPPGKVWVKADYSQIEYRILANLANEKLLIDRFKAGIDFHTSTASLFLGKEIEDITKPDRDKGKVVNYTLGFGGGANKVAKTLGIANHEAEKGFERYWNALPNVANLSEFTRERAKSQGYTKTFFGFRRNLELHNVPAPVRASNLRKSLNTMVQGTAAEFLKIGMLRVEDALKQFKGIAECILTVHDELDFLVDEDRVLEFCYAIAKAMQVPVPDNWAPIIVDLSYGPTWAESGHTTWEPPADFCSDPFTKWGDIMPPSAPPHADI